MIAIDSAAALAGRASAQRLSAAFVVLIVIVAGYTLARSMTSAI